MYFTSVFLCFFIFYTAAVTQILLHSFDSKHSYRSTSA